MTILLNAFFAALDYAISWFLRQDAQTQERLKKALWKCVMDLCSKVRKRWRRRGRYSCKIAYGKAVVWACEAALRVTERKGRVMA